MMTDDEKQEWMDRNGPPEEVEHAIVQHREHGGVLAATKPEEMLEKATSVATILKQIVTDRGLVTEIGDRQHVQCEGWTCLAAMLGATPHEVSNRRNDEGGYTAVVEIKSIATGQTIARASAECNPQEEVWKDRDAYALRSMAATRATGKACRLAFSWIMVLAGYSPTPAEEMTGVKADPKYDCPECGQPLRRSKHDDEYYCWKKRGGCGATFPLDHFDKPFEPEKAKGASDASAEIAGPTHVRQLTTLIKKWAGEGAKLSTDEIAAARRLAIKSALGEQDKTHRHVMPGYKPTTAEIAAAARWIEQAMQDGLAMESEFDSAAMQTEMAAGTPGEVVATGESPF